MANKEYLIYPEHMQEWADRLAADDSQWVTWKFFLMDILVVSLWLFCLSFFLFFLYRCFAFPFMKKKLAMNPVKPLILMYFIAFTTGIFAHRILFYSGPFGYYMQTWLGTESFARWNEWFFENLTIMGHICS